MEWTEFLSYIGHLNKREQTRIKQAFELAQFLHKDQKRKSGEPYFTHPVTIALRLAFIGADADTLIAALLHDAVEDTPATLEEIDAQFDGEVAGLIDGLTKLEASDFDEHPALNEQIETIRKIFSLMQKDIRIIIIKLFDRLHNMETVEFLSLEKQIALARETIELYVRIAEKLSMQDLTYELERLCLKVLEPELYERMNALRQENIKTSKRVMAVMKKELNRLHPSFEKDTKMMFDFTSWNRLRQQLSADGTAVTGVPDLTVVFICKDRESCYQMLGFLHGPWRRETMSFQDYINTPVVNGYQGLQTTIILEDGTRVRCKMRTEEMHEYSRKGAALYAFDAKLRKSFEDLLPWTKRISPLTEHTKDKSEEFWQSLQSDILGRTISIHGPGDLTATLPQDATVLDGAFYLFEEKTFYLQSIKINGEEVPLSSTLKAAMTLNPQFSEKPTLEHSWLQNVKTGFSLALIRSELAKRSKRERVRSGKEMIQELLTQRRRAYLEEFDTDMLSEKVKSLNFESVDQAYIAVAEGRASPAEVYDAMFETKNTAGTAFYSFSYEFPSDDRSQAKMDDVREKFDIKNREISYKHTHGANGNFKVTMKARLGSKDAQMFTDALSAAGAEHLRTYSAFSLLKYTIMITFLIVVWGLDPVMVKYLISFVSPIDFTITRFLSFFILSCVFLGIQTVRQPIRLERIPWKDPLLWVAGVSFMLVGFSTNLALTSMLPQDYVTIVSASAVLIPALGFLPLQNAARTSRLLAMGLVFSGLVLLKYLGQLNTVSFGYGMLLLMSFTIFSICVEEFKRRYHIAARIYLLLFAVAFISFVTSMGLIPFSTITSLTATQWGVMALYGFSVTALPYYVYYSVIMTEWFRVLARYYFLTILLTVGAQYLLFDTIHVGSLFCIVLMWIGSFVISKNNRQAVAQNA